MYGKLKHYLDGWYRTDAGQFFAAQVEISVENMLKQIFGYYAIQVGAFSPGRNLLSASRINTNIIAGQGDTLVCCEFEQLPFATDAVDLVVLPHTLELSSDPHKVLREVDNILVPEGHLIIIGINPWTLWGLWQWGRFRRYYPFYTTRRIKDWLGLLGFEYLGEQSHLVNMLEIPLPAKFSNKQLIQHLGIKTAHRIAGGYVMMAQKKVTTLTPLRSRWRIKPRLVSTGLAEPTTLETNHRCQK